MIFSNPAALWLLASLPVLLVIYFLQQRSRVQRVSTLFLLERVMDETRGGARLRYLRSSWPLVLQLLALATIGLFLAQPVYLDTSTRQRVAVVLDESASMEAFRRESIELLRAKGRSISAGAGRTDWQVVGSLRGGKVIYSGENLEELLAAVESEWQPSQPRHDATPVLRSVRASVGSEGHVLFLTCRDDVSLPGVIRISAGRALDNVAISGFRFVGENNDVFRVVLRNLGNTPTVRELQMRVEGLNPTVTKVHLESDGVAEAAFRWPEGEFSRVVLELLPGDALRLDDFLPLVRPERKVLKVALDESLSSRQQRHMIRLLKAVPESAVILDMPKAADVVVRASLSKDNESWLPNSNELVIASETSMKVPSEGQPIVPTTHPLVRHLSFQRLRVMEMVETEIFPEDEALLWSGNRPLAFMRKARGNSQLIFAADPSDPLVDDDASLLLMLLRFFEDIRQRDGGWRAGNFTAGQPLAFGANTGDLLLQILPVGKPERRESASRSFRAPAAPSHWSVFSDGTELLRGTSYFADIAASELRNCLKLDEAFVILNVNLARNYKPIEHGWAVSLTLLVLFLGVWFLQSRV